ncbi:MAG TPA: hypothetical protein VKX28_12500 [Xanthobacteraceae bacterium]|nr:hypothetical protein [Xanthobacteraceae bacterium]
MLWQVTDGPQWLGTTVSFELAQNDGWTIVLFKHAGGMKHQCSTSWAVFLLSLESLLESGQDRPWPNEIKLDNRE